MKRLFPFLEITLFLTSGLALVVEIVAARLLAPIVGMSLYTWTAIIAVVLAGLSIGHWIGGRLASADTEEPKLSKYIALALFFASLTTGASLIVLPFISNIILELAGVRITTIVPITAIAFLAPSLLVGIVSPLLTTIAVQRPGADKGRIIGRMYALGAAGAIFGTLVAGYVMISWLGSAKSMIIVAVIYAALAVPFAARSGTGGSLMAIATLVLIISQGTALALNKVGDLCDRESLYYCLKIRDTSHFTGWKSEGLEIDRWLHSIRATDGSESLFIRSHHFIDEFVNLTYPGNRGFSAFFIGGGGLSIPNLWRRERPDGRYLVAEIDPEVTDYAASDFGIEIEPPLSVLAADARIALARQGEDRFDIIYNDAYQGLTMPAHLVTREFNQLVKAHLSENGFYILNLTDDSRYPRFLLSMAETLALDFPNVEIWFDNAENQQARRVHYGVVASRNETDFEEVLARRGVKRAWAKRTLKTFKSQHAGVTSQILTDDFAPVDRLMANYCSLQFLRHIGIEIGRPEFCER